LFVAVTVVFFFVVPALAWGSVTGLFGHPARAGVYLVGIIGTVAFFFSGCNLASFKWDDLASRITIVISLLIVPPLMFLPP
jgi:hypothetical protein